MRLFDDADEVEAPLLLAVDFAEEPEVGVDAFEAVLGGFVRREGEDQVLHAVAVDVLESHLRRLGTLQVHVDVRVRIGDAEDEAFLLGLGEIETLFAEDDHVNLVLLGEGERVGENFDLERLHVLEGVFKKRDRDVVGFGCILMEVCLGLVLRDVLFKILGGLENGIAFRKPLGLLGVDNLAEVGASAVVKIVDQVLGLQSRVETEVGLEVEAIRRGMEVLGRCNFRRHEGLGFGRLGEREERNVRGLARTGGRAPAAREQRFGVHFVNHGFECADVADVAHRLMEEAARAGFALPVAGDDLLDVRDRELLGRLHRVREGFLIHRFLAHQHFPSGLGAVLVPVGGTAFNRLIGLAEGEVGVVAGLGGLVVAGLDRMFDQVGRHDDVLGVDVDLVKGEGVGNVRDFVVLNLAGDVAMALEEHDLPGFVVVGDGVGTAASNVAVLRDEVDGDVDGVAGRLGAFGEQAADAVADATVNNRILFFERVVAVVRHDGDAVFIDEAVGEGIAVRMQGLRPIEAVRMGNLRNLGGRRFVRDEFAGLVVGSRNPVLARDDAEVIVLVVTDHDLAGGGNVLADHDRGAGGGVHGD